MIKYIFIVLDELYTKNVFIFSECNFKIFLNHMTMNARASVNQWRGILKMRAVLYHIAAIIPGDPRLWQVALFLSTQPLSLIPAVTVLARITYSRHPCTHTTRHAL